MYKYTFLDVHNKVIGDLFRNFEFKYTNRKDKVGDIMQYLFDMFKNVDVFSAGMQVRDCSEFINYFLRFKDKYEADLQGAEYAVIFVDKDTIKLIKEKSEKDNQENPQKEYRLNDNKCAVDFYDDDFYVDEKCKEQCSVDPYKKSVFKHHIEINDSSIRSYTMLGCYTLMSQQELIKFGVGNIDLLNASGSIPTIVLCEENMQALSESLSKEHFGGVNKLEIRQEFGVNVDDKYFDNNIERIVFAHEFAHLLLRHDTRLVHMKINRETQANCLASILLNDPIASIYMQYLSYFQPPEYQRTLLMYNDFDVTDMTKKLKFVVELK